MDAVHIRERQKYADLLLELLCASVKETKKKSFSLVSRKEHSISEAASRIDGQNQGVFVETFRV